jgi:uncharacterized membrane protein
MDFLADLHEKVIHFPIAFLFLYPVVELVALVSKKEFFSKSALIFLTIGVIGAVGAVLTGNQAFIANPKWSQESLDIFYQHQTYANIVTWSFTLILILRFYLASKNKLTFKMHLIILLLALTGMYFVLQVGNLGGQLRESKFNLSVQE